MVETAHKNNLIVKSSFPQGFLPKFFLLLQQRPVRIFFPGSLSAVVFQALLLPAGLLRQEIIRQITLTEIHPGIATQQHLDPQKGCDLVKSLDLRAAASAGMCPVGIVADDQKLSDPLRLQGQDVVLIFQKNDGLLRRFEKSLLVLRRIVGAALPVLSRKHMEPIHEPEDIFHLLINEPLGDLAFFHRFFERPRQTVIVKIIGDGHLQIQRRRQPQPLTFPAGKRDDLPIQRQITQADPDQTVQLGLNIAQIGIGQFAGTAG